MSVWFPLHTHSHYSLLDGLSKPEQIASRVKECGYEGCALTDHGSLVGVPSFVETMKGSGLKAIAGCEFYLSRESSLIKTRENGSLSHLCALARSDEGWKRLIRASSASNRPENFYRKPRLDLESLAGFASGEWIVFSGHPGSDLADVCFSNPRLAYSARTYEDARTLVHPQWRERVTAEIGRYQKLFGKENFYLEIQLIDAENLPASLVVARILRDLGRKLNVPRVATADSHYARRQDAPDQRILLCSALDTSLKEVQRRLDNAEDVGLAAFFRSSSYHIPGPEEVRNLYEPDELAASLEIAARCTPPTIAGKLLMPEFPCPDGRTPDQELRRLCQAGWKKRIERLVGQHRLQTYQQRLEMEDGVITGAGLSSYFLIVADYIRYAVGRGALVGEGRGSAAGCLVSYLLGITSVDPVRYDLIFERFYNAGRNAPGRIALPDIDTDFPVGIRDQIIDYCRQTYGEDRVCQMATYGRMQGRGALKDVLRAHERCSFEEMNRITAFIPDESSISDDLQEMLDAGEDPSIIRWALENEPEPLKEWCFLTPEGELDGPLALDFAQAIRLEGTKRSQGKHPSGVVISSVPLADVVPMIYDRSSGMQLVGVDMRDAEKMGLPKFDILATDVLGKIMDAQSIIRTGRMCA